MFDRTLPRHRPPRPCGRIPGSARIAACHRPCGLAASWSPSASSSSSSPPSNGSLNCTGSLYGASSQNGLGGSWFRGGFSTSRSIGQPLADDGADRALSTLYIIDPESDSVAVAEIEFGKVAMQMGLADVEIEALDGIRVRLGAVAQVARPFLSPVIDRIMTSEALTDASVRAKLISHQPAL